MGETDLEQQKKEIEIAYKKKFKLVDRLTLAGVALGVVLSFSKPVHGMVIGEPEKPPAYCEYSTLRNQLNQLKLKRDNLRQGSTYVNINSYPAQVQSDLESALVADRRFASLEKAIHKMELLVHKKGAQPDVRRYEEYNRKTNTLMYVSIGGAGLQMLALLTGLLTVGYLTEKRNDKIDDLE